MSGWRLTDRGRDGGSYAVAALIFTLALLACISLIPPVLMIGMWVEGPNEGWNATHSLHAFSRALYPSPSASLITIPRRCGFTSTEDWHKSLGIPFFLVASSPSRRSLPRQPGFWAPCVAWAGVLVPVLWPHC